MGLGYEMIYLTPQTHSLEMESSSEGAWDGREKNGSCGWCGGKRGDVMLHTRSEREKKNWRGSAFVVDENVGE